MLDFDYGEEEEEDNNAAPAPVPSLPQQQQQVAAGIDSLGRYDNKLCVCKGNVVVDLFMKYTQ